MYIAQREEMIREAKEVFFRILYSEEKKVNDNLEKLFELIEGNIPLYEITESAEELNLLRHLFGVRLYKSQNNPPEIGVVSSEVLAVLVEEVLGFRALLKKANFDIGGVYINGILREDIGIFVATPPEIENPKITSIIAYKARSLLNKV